MMSSAKTRNHAAIMRLNVFFLFFLMLFLSSFVEAQLSGRPERGFQAGNSYAISDIERINLTGGGVGMTIPLASLPKGRGNAPGFSISITYDSKIWDSAQHWESDSLEPTGSDPITHDYTRNLLVHSEEGGWQLNTHYKLKVVFRNSQGTPEEPCVPFNDNYSRNGYAFRVEMKLPGGGATVFRPYGSGHHYEDYHKEGFYEMNPNGQAHHRHLVTIVNDPDRGTHAQCSDTYPQIDSDGMDYYAQDGSGVRLFIPYDAAYAYTPATPNRPWIMYYPDGTIVENMPADDPSTLQRITDANGNRVRIQNGTYNGASGLKIVDDAERFIFVSGWPYKVYQSGVDGAVLETTLAWKSIWAYRKYRTVDPAFIYTIPEYKKYQEVKQAFVVLDTITLPSQAGSQTYEFEYHGSETDPGSGSQNYTNGWGELKSVKTPSGAVAEYVFNLPANEDPFTTFLEILSNSVTRKDLKYDETYDGATTLRTDTWLYDISHSQATITAPDGSVTRQYHYGKGPYIPDQGTDWRTGLVHGIENPDGSVVSREWKQHGHPVSTEGQPLNPYLAAENLTISAGSGSPALTSRKEFEYDQNSNLIEVREYGFIPAGQSNFPLLRKTVNTYYNQTLGMASSTTDSNWYANPGSPKLLHLLKSTEIRDGSNNPLSRSEFFYDGGASDPQYGRLTETKVWDSHKGNQYQAHSVPLTASNSVSTFAEYDTYGNVTKTKDPKLIETTITFGCIDASSSCSDELKNLYPTKTETASNHSSLKRTSAATYDLYTGVVKTATDVDNSISTAMEYDVLGRPTKVKTAVGTALESWVRTEYDDVNRRMIVRSDIEAVGDGRKVATQFFDQLGRVRLSKTLEDAATQSATNETDGIKVQTRYLTAGATSGGFTYQLTSNPYRASYSSSETDSTMGWTRSKVWPDGKRSEAETFSGAALPAPWGSNSSSTGVVVTEINANATTVTDQAGKQRRSVTNALGHLIRVDEPNGAGQLGSITSPNQPTEYSFDVLNNLLTVTQAGSGIEQCGPAGGTCSQTRSFTYSSLSRLISATNPESGTIGYEYDPNGNLTKKIDARGVHTDYVYDELNRLKNRNYSTPGGTPANYQASPNVVYTYDNVTNAKGKLTKVSTGTGPNTSTTEYVEFDILGRVKRSIQETDGVIYGGGEDPTRWMTYSYNLSGALIEQQYPSGRRVKNVLDADGELAEVQSKKNPAHAYWKYADHFTYNAAGAVTSMQLGNGRWESTQFNSRLQPTQIALGSVQNGTDKLKLNYEYGELNVGTGQTIAGTNNGNVAKQTITVQAVGATPGFVATQYYAYDSLNRIQIATENVTPDGQPVELGWRQHFKFDRYGNRNFVTTGETATTTLGTCPTEVCNPTISPDTNKITSTSYSFDAAGNTKRDAQDRKFTYDAENKQTKVETLSGETVTGTVGEYWYDGDGRRVKKRAYEDNVLTEETIFVYDAASRLVAEYSNQVAPPQNAKVAYLTNDHLGSPRINTDINGNITARHDYHPYGEEIATSKRTAALGYASDTVRKQFTGYERDNEINLDFAQARYYSPAHGRFTSPDPYLPSALVEVPQSWNRYSYVLNKPFVYVDPSGEDWEATGDKNDPYKWIDKCAEGQKNCYKVVSAQVDNSLRVYGSKDEKDITNYEANKSGMVDMREVAKHHDAEFVVKPGAGEPYLNTRTGSALFNVAYQYSQLYPDDQKLMMTAGSLANGGSLPIHKSHKQGNNVDLRYMGADGKTIQSKIAYSLADVGRTKDLIGLFREQSAGLDAVITGNPPSFGLPDIANKALKNQHKDHMHFQRNYPKTVPIRPGRQKD